jgi:anti-anti-sigma factor
MELTYDDVNGVRTIRLKGRLDLDGAAAIEMKLTSLIVTQQMFVVVDLSAVDFLASMGLATLVRSARAVRLRKGNMVLFNPIPSVRQVIASTRIDQVLPVYMDLDEARRVAAAPFSDA